MNKTSGLAVLLVLLAPGAALAGHGKAGLWNVSTSMTMPDMPQMPPEAAAMMKQQGLKMPMGGEPVTTRICMSQAEVDADTPPRTGDREMHCDTHMISKTPSSMTAETVCGGKMQGTGHLQVSYSGTEHYSGSYSFKGTMDGRPQEMTSSFKGDWVKADCGAVKPSMPPHG
jgi:hypothetical protein